MDKLTAKKVIQLLELPTDTYISITDHISDNAPVAELIAALQERSTPRIRHILCYMLGDRREKAAVPILIKCLKDRSPSVRATAADSLGKIGDPRAGEALFERFVGAEKSMGARHMLASALGAVGYEPAIPLLIQALEDSNGTLRGCAAWSLGVLHAQEAKDALERALAREAGSNADSAYAANRMREAIKIIGKPKGKKRKSKSR
jgi:HEAT repeat protein